MTQIAMDSSDLILVQFDDFDVASEYLALSQNSQTGAIATFVGKVRDMNLGSQVTGLTLEHYPAMTEKSLAKICQEAKSRWPLQNIRLIHRVGKLALGDQIVFVGVSSAHRQAAFESCQFIMDELKTKAPFWKKETTPSTERWIESRQSDQEAAKRWQKSNE